MQRCLAQFLDEPCRTTTPQRFSLRSSLLLRSTSLSNSSVSDDRRLTSDENSLCVDCNTGEMNVSDAVAARRSIRDFLPNPVDDELLRDLLERAARAPSGGNVQPWRIYVLNGSRMIDFLEFL